MSRTSDHNLIDLGLTAVVKTTVDNVLSTIGSQRLPVNSVSECMQILEQENSSLSLIIDIDVVPTDENLLLRIYKLKPHCQVLILSTRTFHPELKNAMQRNVFAIINKANMHEELPIILQALVEFSLSLVSQPRTKHKQRDAL